MGSKKKKIMNIFMLRGNADSFCQLQPQAYFRPVGDPVYVRNATTDPISLKVLFPTGAVVKDYC